MNALTKKIINYNIIKKLILSTTVLIIVAGCNTTDTGDIQAKKADTEIVSNYQNMSCDEIVAEYKNVQNRLFKLKLRIDEVASSNKKDSTYAPLFGLVGGIILLTDAGNHDTTPQQQEYAKELGKAEAIKQVAAEKKCTLPPDLTQQAANAKN